MSTRTEEIIEYVILGAVVLVSYACGIASVESQAIFSANHNNTLKLVFYKDLNVSVKND